MKRIVQWDEKNIEETSAERGTRMKISEPKTPYVYPSNSTLSVEDEEMPSIALDNVVDRLNDYSVNNNAKKVYFESKPATDTCEWDTTSGNESNLESESEDFTKKRNMHYTNMSEALRMGKEMLEDDDDEEEDKVQRYVPAQTASKKESQPSNIAKE